VNKLRVNVKPSFGACLEGMSVSTIHDTSVLVVDGSHVGLKIQIVSTQRPSNANLGVHYFVELIA